ncbi:MAG: hypothetical protein HY432_01050 [Candidatus Liptonbacteria bacterium]|nr:hypothetical protein [Candidatus Liptonbacteria bacterium]
MKKDKERVVTNLGIGDVVYADGNGRVEVEIRRLNNGCFRRRLVFHREEVYEFGGHMVVRAVRVDGLGLLSNITPFRISEHARKSYDSPGCVREMKLFFDLHTGEFEKKGPWELPGERYLPIYSWMDRSGKEPYDCPGHPCDTFDRWISKQQGTNGGIFVPAVLDTKRKRIARFAIAAKPGIIFFRAF